MTQPSSPYSPPKHPASSAGRNKFYWRYTSTPEYQALSREDRKRVSKYANRKLWSHWQYYIALLLLQLPGVLIFSLHHLQNPTGQGNKSDLYHLVKDIPTLPTVLLFAVCFGLLYNRIVTPLYRKHTRQWIIENQAEAAELIEPLTPHQA